MVQPVDKQNETQILFTLSNMFSILVVLFPGLTDQRPLRQSHRAVPGWGLGLSHSFYVTYGPSCPHKPWPHQRQTQQGILSGVPTSPTRTHRSPPCGCLVNNFCCWGFNLVWQQKYFFRSKVYDRMDQNVSKMTEWILPLGLNWLAVSPVECC